MKILPQLTQRQCKQFTTQDLSERLDLEITYTKSMLQVLCAKIWFEKNCTIAAHNAIVRMSSYVMDLLLRINAITVRQFWNRHG